MKYKYFILKSINAIMILLLLAGYQFTLCLREKEETLIDLQSQINQLRGEYTFFTEGQEKFQTNKEEVDDAGKTDYKDGRYEGKAEGFGGDITVEVTVKNRQIDTIEIISAPGEDETYLAMAREMIDDIQKQKTTEVDTISGATYSSKGIKNAVKEALQSAL